MPDSPSLRLRSSQREKLLLPLSLWLGLLSSLDVQFFAWPREQAQQAPQTTTNTPIIGRSELSPGEPREKSLLPASHQLRVHGESSSPLWDLRTEDRLQEWKLISHLAAATE